MTRQARPDLRARMQKVASKPAQHPDTPPRSRRGATTSRGTRAATPRASAAAAPKRAARPETRRRTRAATPPVEPPELDVAAEEDFDPPVDGRTRVETLTGWFLWEMVAVPRKRLRYMRELLLGG